MAYFAQLHGAAVSRVIVVADADAPDEAAGIAFCRALFGADTAWRRCAPDGWRKQFPAAGFTYDEAAEMFVAPAPFPSWTLDVDRDWQAPVPRPADGDWIWNETAQAWEAGT